MFHRSKKFVVNMSYAEARLAVTAMNEFRNQLIDMGKPTEDVDDILLMIIKKFK